MLPPSFDRAEEAGMGAHDHDARPTRRQVLAGGARLAFAATLGATGSMLLAPGGRATARGLATTRSEVSEVRIELPEHPYFDGTMMQPDPALLDRLAARYARRRGDRPLVMTRFLFGDVPVALFDRIFATPSPQRALPVGSYLWLFHLSGYFGGVWLREELVRADRNPQLTSFSSPQTRDEFVAEVAKAAGGLERAGGPRAAVLAASEASLSDTPNPEDPAMPERGLVDTFGYNQGYLLQILERPPEGLTAPPGLVRCAAEPAADPLRCRYGTSRLAALRRYEPVARRLRRGDGRYGELAAAIAPVQAAGIARGRQVWDELLTVQGFPQPAYEQLLDISSAFLETVQATALATVRAVAERDAATGRRALTANAMLGLWLTSYLVGITDGRPGRALPSFVAR